MSEHPAEVAIFSGLNKTLHYRVPSWFVETAKPGCRVLVPLGRREVLGLIVSLEEGPGPSLEKIALRPIHAVLDPSPVVSQELLALARWVSRYYFHPLGEVLQSVLPPGMDKSLATSIRLTPPGREKAASAPATLLLELLVKKPLVPLREIKRKYRSLGDWEEELKSLEAEGCIERAFDWTPPAGRAKGRGDEGIPEDRTGFQGNESGDRITLFADQNRVFETVLPHVRDPGFKPFLLFGVTGSGKTEIYMRLIEEVVKGGRGALVLVPEIALSTQIEALFRERFGAHLAVWHSRLPAWERMDQWSLLQRGEKKVLLGVRSSVFMPVSNLGLIIVDEEHDTSYKQEDGLRYHARDVALVRARMLGIPVVLGSATPSIQSLFHCRAGRYSCVTLPKRVFDRPLPDIRVVDMRRESGRNRILSRELQQALVETVENGNQALLFLNRRGFATFTLCNACGHVIQCAHCSVSLTYHQEHGRLCCHYCGWERPVPESCPACGHAALFPHGFGTERVEEEVRRLLPQTPVVRLDRDTALQPRRMAETLTAMRRRKAKILIGTQMISKGHDFPHATLVGVVNGDTSLQIADFRAGEATVQLLMQVAGRAGRGESPGRVLLQTYNPTHYTIEAVLRMDYMGFFGKELASRERLQYPPFTRFLKFLVTSPNEEKVRQAALQLAGLCREAAADLRIRDRHLAVLGPSPAPHAKLKNRFRWHIFAKAWNSRDLQEFTEAVLAGKNDITPLNRVQVAVDRDPVMSL